MLAEPEDVARAVRSSFDEVYAAESRAIVGLATLVVGLQAVAEELAQDAFLRLFGRATGGDHHRGRVDLLPRGTPARHGAGLPQR